MTDEDIHTFTPAKPVRPPASRTAGWPRLLGLAAGAGLLLWLLLLAGGAAALWSLADGGAQGLHVNIGGEDWEPVVLETNHGGLALIGLALGMACALAAALMVVPVAVLLALVVTALGVGFVLLAVALVAAVALSPLWLLALLMWLLLRRRTPRAATMSA